MTEAIAKGRVQEAAYLSGDPALQSAAVITVQDAEVINARAMALAAQILFYAGALGLVEISLTKDTKSNGGAITYK